MKLPSLIDELPVLAARCGTRLFAGRLGRPELRHKESDRITALVNGFRAAAASVPSDARMDSYRQDIASRRADGVRRMTPTRDGVRARRLGATGPIVVTGAEAVAVSYPRSRPTSRGSRDDAGQDLPRRLHASARARSHVALSRACAGNPRRSTNLIEGRENECGPQIFVKRRRSVFSRSVEKKSSGNRAAAPPRRRRYCGGTFADPDNRAAINLDGDRLIDVPLVDLIPRIPLDGRRHPRRDRAQLERL